MPTNREPRVLLVDDEDQILQGLYLQLHREFEVTTAQSGAEALEELAKDQQFAVLVSDMRMPGMDGAELLSNARRTCPDTVRVLLTGHADMDAAACAVNEGEIFRFLTKPIEGNQLRNALHEAARKHNQLTAERDLLEKTLGGTVEVLTNVLGIVNPEAFSCANR
ncbi:MAG: response regulator, partial [Planctomycetota bacterium]